jgi:hypothetical protein
MIVYVISVIVIIYLLFLKLKFIPIEFQEYTDKYKDL